MTGSGCGTDQICLLVENIKAGLVNTYHYAMPIVAILLVIIVIWAGIQYITGGPKGAETAKKTIIAAVIGALIIILSKVILDQVVGFINPPTP
ncbi:MAG: hypothetical protein V1807_01360 [Patescibacteria group bacterium]